MKAVELYAKLDKDFIKPGLSDDWSEMKDYPIWRFVSTNWKERMMGLLIDNHTDEVSNVFTAVFPSDKVIKELLAKKTGNTILFTHHPLVWDINQEKIFHSTNEKLLEKLASKKISVYTLHSPLDDYGPYSTSVTLAQALGLRPIDKFFPYYGGYAGAIAISNFRTVNELSGKMKLVLGQEKTYNYGNNDITNERIAIIAGGGLTKGINELTKLDVKVLITGISALSDYSREAHNLAKKNEISIIGGSHYSTEKFACINLCNYFRKLRLHSEFIEDEPCMQDM